MSRRIAIVEDDPAIRARAAFAIGSMQDPAAVPTLLLLLDDEDPSVRADAAFALGQSGRVAWYAGHGQPAPAFRRFRQSASAKIGDRVIPIWYPSARRLQAAFRPWFTPLQSQSLGLWLPPSYLGHFVERWPRLFEGLNRFEQRAARVTGGWGDHYIIVFRREVQ